MCQVVEGRSGVSVKNCSGCGIARYCGGTCQKQAWKRHKPDCLRVQGKPVPERALARAEEAAGREAARWEEEMEREAEAHRRLARHEAAAFVPGNHGLHTCMHEPGRSDLPRGAEDSVIAEEAARRGLALEQHNFGMPPAGLPANGEHGGRCFELHGRGLQVLLPYTKLFEGKLAALWVRGCWARRRPAEDYEDLFDGLPFIEVPTHPGGAAFDLGCVLDAAALAVEATA